MTTLVDPFSVDALRSNARESNDPCDCETCKTRRKQEFDLVYGLDRAGWIERAIPNCFAKTTWPVTVYVQGGTNRETVASALRILLDEILPEPCWDAELRREASKPAFQPAVMEGF